MKTAPILAALLLLAGCSTPTTLPSGPVPAKKEADKRVTLDTSAAGLLKITRVTSETGPDGIFRFQVDVQNVGPSAKSFVYDIEWLDRTGALLPMATGGVPWLLLRNEASSLSQAAPSPLVKDFRLKFRAK